MDRQEWGYLPMNMESLLFNLSQLSDNPRFKVSAILVDKKKIVSVGVNKKKTSPNALRFHEYGFWHAETYCLHKAEYTKGCTLYVGRFSSRGKLLAKPCSTCSEAILATGVKKVIYTSPEGLNVLHI